MQLRINIDFTSLDIWQKIMEWQSTNIVSVLFWVYLPSHWMTMHWFKSTVFISSLVHPMYQWITIHKFKRINFIFGSSTVHLLALFCSLYENICAGLLDTKYKLLHVHVFDKQDIMLWLLLLWVEGYNSYHRPVSMEIHVHSMSYKHKYCLVSFLNSFTNCFSRMLSIKSLN